MWNSSSTPRKCTQPRPWEKVALRWQKGHSKGTTDKIRAPAINWTRRKCTNLPHHPRKLWQIPTHHQITSQTVCFFCFLLFFLHGCRKWQNVNPFSGPALWPWLSPAWWCEPATWRPWYPHPSDVGSETDTSAVSYHKKRQQTHTPSFPVTKVYSLQYHKSVFVAQTQPRNKITILDS